MACVLCLGVCSSIFDACEAALLRLERCYAPHGESPLGEPPLTEALTLKYLLSSLLSSSNITVSLPPSVTLRYVALLSSCSGTTAVPLSSYGLFEQKVGLVCVCMFVCVCVYVCL